MAESSREQLSALLRRIEEVRGLAPGAGGPVGDALADAGALVPVLTQLVDELERSHRRLIETNVQLVSLREVASSLVSIRDAREATRLVARYLRGALGFDQVGLLLADRERGVLSGTWAWIGGLTPLELPLEGAAAAASSASVDAASAPGGRPAGEGPAAEAGAPERAPVLRLPEGHELARVFALHRSIECVALEPGVGVLAAARGPEAVPYAPPAGAPAGERARLESAAFTLAPMLENARLVHELSRSQRFLADVLDSMPSAMVAFGPDGRALSLNRAAQDLLGVDETTAAGLPVRDLLGDEGEEHISGTLATGQPVVRLETMLRAASGAPLPARLTTSRLRDEHGHAYGALATFLDLTPLKAAEDRARQMDQLAALGRFTSSVAHEIRNPLTGIGMGVRRLARVLADRPSEAEHLEFVLHEIRRLDDIVQQLFDVTHPRKLDLTPRSLEDTVHRAERSLSGLLEERNVRVECEVEPSLPAAPHDADQMQQVFINLLKNAAEASPNGARVRVRIARDAITHALQASVTDEGSGIDETTRQTLFEPFFTTKPKGTGLGLYITHEIVKRHGGTLAVSSEPGHGATFTLELPLDPSGGSR
jgi:PAS domain S-box-containing protein